MIQQRVFNARSQACLKALRRYHLRFRRPSFKAALIQQWVLLIGGNINLCFILQVSAKPFFSYCGARYFKPSEREDGHVIKFTIQGHKPQKDDIIPNKQVQKTAGFATWYRFLPFGVLLIAPKIYSLVASTALRWLPRGWIGIRRKSPSY